MFKLAILLLQLTVPSVSGEVALPPLMCDDGSPPRHADGSPNWACFIDGYSPNDRLSWPERTAECFDEEGEENGDCVLSTKACKSKLACFDMWLGCTGTYKCLEDESWIGCNDGVCVVEAEPSSYSAGEPARPGDSAPVGAPPPAHSRASVTPWQGAANPGGAA